MMKKMLITAAAAVFALSLVSCPMPLDGPGEARNSSLQNISGFLVKNVMYRYAYMGGSVVYNPSDIANSQLSRNVVVAVRLGEVKKNGPDDSAVYTVNPDYEIYGYLRITDISDASVSFAYYEFSDGWGEARQKGVFTLAAGENADLNGDGRNDVTYAKPSQRRKGSEKAMWLTFLSSRETLNTAMFSVIPQQYERSVYPGGLIGVNPEGRYIVNKYDIGTTTRAAVKSVAYGDYVIDSETGDYSRYIGSSSSKNARSVNDSDLADTSQEGFSRFEGFKTGEFSGNYSVYDLLAAFPDSLQPAGYRNMSVEDCVSYLNNTVLPSYTFVRDYTEQKAVQMTPELTEAVAQVKSFSSDEILIFNRYFMSQYMSDVCPSFDSYSTALPGILPLVSVNLGFAAVDDDMDNEERAAAIAETRSAVAERSLAAVTKSIPCGQTCELPSQEVTGTKTEGYAKYVHDRDAMINEFSQLHQFDVLPFLKTFIKNTYLKNFIEAMKVKAKLGVGGHFNISFGNVEAGIKVYVFVQSEVEDSFKYTMAKTSLFADEPTFLNEDGTKATADDIKDADQSEEDMKAALKELDDHVAEAEKGKKPQSNTAIELMDLNRTFTVGPVPFVLGCKGSFDMFLKTAVQLEFKGYIMGFTAMAGVNIKVGMNTSLRWATVFGHKVFPYAADITPYADGSKKASYAAYAGPKTTEKNDKAFGGGASLAVIPSLTIEPYVGIGTSSVNVYVSSPVTATFPFTTYNGLIVYPDLRIVNEYSLESSLDWAVKTGFRFNASICGFGIKRDYSKDLFTMNLMKAVIFDVRLENLKIVKYKGPQVKDKPKV